MSCSLRIAVMNRPISGGCVDGFDRRKATGFVVGIGQRSTPPSRSSVVVTVASSDSVLSMIASA